MLRFDAVRNPAADNENLTPFMQALREWEQQPERNALAADPLYLESFLPVTERTIQQPIFRHSDAGDVFPVKLLADVIETYRRRSPAVFEAKYTERLLQIACLCFSINRHLITRWHHSAKRKKS